MNKLIVFGSTVLILGSLIMPKPSFALPKLPCWATRDCPIIPKISIPVPRISIPVPEEEKSHSSVMTQEYYSFTIHNPTSNRISFTINGDYYTLDPNTKRTLNNKYLKAYGTNSGNVRKYPPPQLAYDNETAIPGVQQAVYTINSNSSDLYFAISSTGSIGISLYPVAAPQAMQQSRPPSSSPGPSPGRITQPPFPKPYSMPPHVGGLPPGHTMAMCGCWGPNPQPFGNEPRCASGAVQFLVCPALNYCAPGHPQYGWVCR
jgi:hypothetical protein